MYQVNSDEITNPSSKFNGCTIVVREKTGHAITYRAGITVNPYK